MLRLDCDIEFFFDRLDALTRTAGLAREIWNTRDGVYRCSAIDDTDPFFAHDEMMQSRIKASNEQMNTLLNNGKLGSDETPSLTSKVTFSLREEMLVHYFEECCGKFQRNYSIENQFSGSNMRVGWFSLDEMLRIVKITLVNETDLARDDTTRMVNEYMESINVSPTEALLYSDPHHFNNSKMWDSPLNRAFLFGYLGLARIMRCCMQLYDGERWTRIGPLLPSYWTDDSAKVQIGFGFFESRLPTFDTILFIRSLSWIVAGYKPIRADYAIKRLLIPMFTGLFSMIEETAYNVAAYGKKMTDALQT